MDEVTKLNLAMSIERTYTSFMRNCFVLFTLGLTIINLTKTRKTEKMVLSFVIMFAGILLGYYSSKEYYDRIKLIEKGEFKKISLISKTLKITSVVIIILFVILCYKIINLNEKYNLVSDLKKKIIRK